MIQKPVEYGHTQLAFGSGTVFYVGSKCNESDVELNYSLIALIKNALKLGYRHLDCAEGYGTEREVGVALKEFLSENPTVTRNDIFITSKFFNSVNDIRGGLKAALSRLQIPSVDLYLVHAPFFHRVNYSGSLQDVWTQMESLVHDGLTRHIGVSNFRIEDFEKLLPSVKIKPLCNQIEFNPYLQQPKLQEYCKNHGIGIACYSPLGPLTFKNDGPVNTVIDKIASKHGKTNAQVLLKWVIQKGYLAVTISRQEERAKEYLGVLDKNFMLTEEESKEIEEVGSTITFRKYWAEEFNNSNN